MGALPFASSNGSPVVLVPTEIAAEWLGIGDDKFYAQYLERSSKVRRTEYGGFSTMPLAGSKVLIFAGEIHTTWLKEPDGGTLIREGCPHTVARARKLVASVRATAWKGFTKLTLIDGRFVVVDSAMATNDLATIDTSNGLVKAKLDPGTYQVDIAALGGIDFARLRRVAPAKRPRSKR